MGDTITLDGRQFAGVSQSLTANQDDYILAHLRLSGALEVLADADGHKRTDEERAEELLTRILLSGRTYHILAGCLTEEGKKWTRAEADRNAAIFGDISEETEKALMRSSIVRFVIGFFAFAGKSPATSPKSSSRSERGLPIASAEGATSESSPA